MLLLAHVHYNVFVFRRLTDDHALVHRNRRADKQRPTILRVEQAVATGFAGFKHHQGALYALRNIALIRLISVEHAVHNPVAVGIGQELLTIPHQATGGNTELQVAGARLTGTHVHDLRLARAELFHYRAHIAFRHFDHQQLHRLQQVAVFVGFINHLRTADGKFIPLTPHGFNQNG